MPDDTTTVQVSVEVWRWLNARKGPGDSMDDVLRRELGVGDDRDEDQDVEPDGGGADDGVVSPKSGEVHDDPDKMLEDEAPDD